jgi:MSHA biogenesis protein MshM
MSLYLEHFGLREPPFRITPHTDFFFTGANRGPTLDALIYAITQDEGIVKVTGEVGSGKTMLCRMLLERLPDEVESLYLANPSLSRTEILGAIADELGIPADGKTTHSMIRTLQDALVQRYANGKRVVILIDEAHAMPAESLEEIRLLSNLESKATKLLQIALFAQPEIEDRLAANDMRQLRERITQHFNLSPLKANEVGGYLEFRLRAAGYRGPSPFTERAIEQIARISEGLSRRINILADKALLAAYSAGSYKVDTNEIQAANQDARFSPLQQKPPFNYRPLLWGIGSGAAVVSIALAAFTLWPKPPAPQTEPTIAAPVIVPEPPKPALAVAAAPPPATISPPVIATSASSQFGPLTQDALARFANWQSITSRERYFIQLLATDAGSGADVENFLMQASKQLNPDDLRVYRSSLSGRDRVGVIYGDYPNRQAATSAMRSLPEAIRLAQPYPRQVSKLQQ